MPSSPKRLGNVAYSMVMFVVVSVLAGVLVAGLFVPFAGLAGVSSKAAAEEMSNLPAELETPAQPERSKVLLGDGSVLAYFFDENRVYVPLDKIAPIMQQAQIAIEDHRFYEHGALDLKGTLRAFVRNQAADGVSQGGSSITQQYVKQVQIQACEAKGDAQCVKDVQATTYERKIRELRYAIALEKNLSKDQILERYLNIAYYGDGAYGVEAAAKHYFSTSAAKLNLAQAAMLAGLVQNPDANNPVSNRSAAIDRRDVVINRMVELKLVDAAQSEKAKDVTFDRDKVKGTRNGCVGSRYPFLCDYVFRTLLTTESLGKTAEDRENMVKRGGITVETAIDPASQDKAQRAVSNVVDPRAPIISTMDMIQPGTGLIVAMAQSRDVMGSDAKAGETYYNYSVSQAMGGAEGYQAGSTFKAFTAAAALEKGIPLSKRYNAASPMNFSGKTFTNCDGPFTLGGEYKPKNSTGTNGNMDMYTAAARSVNTYFIQLEQTTGMCEVTTMAKKLGVQLADPNLDLVKDYENIPSFTLGVAEVTPLSVAEAYATFASRGIHCNPIIIDKITSRDGKEMAAPTADCKRVIPQDVADGMNKLLAGVMKGNGTGVRVRVPGIEDQAGKTGTIDNNNAVWYAGYTPELVGVSMIAIDKTRSPWTGANKRTNGVDGYTLPYTGITLGGSGSGDAGVRIWTPAMTAALEGMDHTSFTDPPSSIERGKRIEMPSIAGLGLDEATKKLEEAGFTVTNRSVYSTQAAGTFLGFSQMSGTVAQFGTIYANISNGREDPAVVAERRARERAAEEGRKAEQDRAAADRKAADDRAAADKKSADKKAAGEKAAAEKKKSDDKAAADKKAADDRAAADKKKSDDKAAADKKAADDKAAADKKKADKGGG